MDNVTAAEFGAALLQVTQDAARNAGDENVDISIEIVEKSELTFSQGSLDLSNQTARSMFALDVEVQVCSGLSGTCQASILSFTRRRGRALASSVTVEVERAYDYVASANVQSPALRLAGAGFNVTSSTQTALSTTVTVTKAGAAGSDSFDESFGTQGTLSSSLSAQLPSITVQVSAPVVITPPLPPPSPPPSPPALPPLPLIGNGTATEELPAAAIVGIVLAVLVLIAGSAAVLVMLYRKRRLVTKRVVPVGAQDYVPAVTSTSGAGGATTEPQANAPADAEWRVPQAASGARLGEPGPEVEAVEEAARDAQASASPPTEKPKVTKPPALQWASNLGFDLDPASGSLVPASAATPTGAGVAKLRTALKVAAAANRISKEPDRPAPVLDPMNLQKAGQSNLILGRWKSERRMSAGTVTPSPNRPAPNRPAPTWSPSPLSAAKRPASAAPIPPPSATRPAPTPLEPPSAAPIPPPSATANAPMLESSDGSDGQIQEATLQAGFNGGGGIMAPPPKLEEPIGPF